VGDGGLGGTEKKKAFVFENTRKTFIAHGDWIRSNPIASYKVVIPLSLYSDFAIGGFF